LLLAVTFSVISTVAVVAVECSSSSRNFSFYTSSLFLLLPCHPLPPPHSS